LLLTILTEVPTVAAQAPHGPFEIGSLALKFEPGLIECLTGKHHDMKFVEDDPGVRKVLSRALDIGRTHIHGNRLNLGGIGTVLEQCLGKGSEGLCTGRKADVEKDLATLKKLNPKLAGELEHFLKTGREIEDYGATSPKQNS